MKKLLSICFGIGFGSSIFAAGSTFSATNLPSVAGQYNCSYYSTDNPNVPAMLTLTTNPPVGGPPLPGTGATWDFSQPQQPGETILRTDIISPANGMDGGSFPDAAYAEQDTTETPSGTNQSAWRYYGITDQGRSYYGFYVPDSDADGLAVFDPPTTDIPPTVVYGQTWTRATSWNTTVEGIYGIYNEFSDTVTVDASGTLILPNIGGVSALRVHEIQGYTALLDGYVPVEIATNQYYYWLVPGLGVAVQITEYGVNTLEPTYPLPYTNSVERMFYASYLPKPLPSPATPVNLYLQLQNGSACLTWNPFTNSAIYQVQSAGSLISPNWQALGLTSNTNWSDALSPTQRFYRVIGFP
jgi:hypothetical protein